MTEQGHSEFIQWAVDIVASAIFDRGEGGVPGDVLRRELKAKSWGRRTLLHLDDFGEGQEALQTAVESGYLHREEQTSGDYFWLTLRGGAESKAADEIREYLTALLAFLKKKQLTTPARFETFTWDELKESVVVSGELVTDAHFSRVRAVLLMLGIYPRILHHVGTPSRPLFDVLARPLTAARAESPSRAPGTSSTRITCRSRRTARSWISEPPQLRDARAAYVSI